MASACSGRGRSPMSRLLGCLVVCFFCAVGRAQLQPLEVRSYSYASFQPGNSREAKELEVLKDALINRGALQLTPDTGNIPSSRQILSNKSGSVLLRQPFTLWRLDDDGEAASGRNGTGNSTAGQVQRARIVSFNSTFSMNVYYDSARRPGEGLTFLIAPSLDGQPPGSEGGFLGLTNATLEASPAKNRFVAIEFDTFNQTYDPPNGNHVGLDIGSVVSNKTANLADFNITSIATTEANAANYTVWVEYDGAARHISVYMSIRGKPKPASPVLDSPLDLSVHVPEKAYLGFSASTGTTFELNCILDWTLSIEIIPDKKSKMWLILVAVIVPVTAVVVAVAAYFLTKMLRARRSMERKQERLEHTLSNLPGMPRGFAYEKLRKATKNFDERLLLGKGGYGEVYKGMLPADDAWPEGMEVAVKRFIRDDAKCVNDFLAEVDIINRLRHKNIVPLIGWCYKKRQLLLVYEYMPNGSLDQHLFRRSVHEQRPVLSWESRYGIVADVAAGLHYVHHEYTRMVLHRDIKASNVLLDASFRARLGDFGLARVIEHDKNSFTDLGVAGTRGFIAPDYSVGHKATRQTDVFAFGALVLEVVTGRYALLGNPSCPLLSDWVWQMHGRGALLGAVDQSLGTTEFDNDEANRLLLLALACSSPNPGDRPTMPQVLQILSKAAAPPEVPLLKPQFVWPPEGGAHFELSNIEIEMTTSGTGNGASTLATHDTSYSSLQVPTALTSTEDYFPALSSGR
ncbi:probable L-type lectin-domain containing receptor kinase S.5 [Phragmites australis]|uniref:probable L-type lectin-domain containing receptor kinase S.5 n=1 Tax=Phragmites australis TaxID=29695 RepID=UPI002D76BD65|nr:probable L-type lectin-domain containing receptor kinase S.5 [Phragmites australis]